MLLDRTNKSFFGQWWWTIDRVALLLIGSILALGSVLVMASSPPIAESRGLPAFYFVHRQLIFLTAGILITFIFSLLSPIVIRRIALLGFILCTILMIAVLLIGTEVKGAKSWINFAWFSIQPSEMMKPFFIVLVAWLLALKNIRGDFPGYTVVTALWIMVIILIVSQPDIGMVFLYSIVWGSQLFLAGLPMIFVIGGAVIGISGLTAAYFMFPHVANRMKIFISPESGDSYQNEKALEAFVNGGLFGQGPGEGIIKDILPDAHTDFVFAVAGEEFGLILCIFIVILYASVVARGFYTLLKESDLFVIYACSGLLLEFGLQAIINMGVSLNLLPNTGMTLPFMSYGGSSMISVACSMGMVLAFTRKRYGAIKR